MMRFLISGILGTILIAPLKLQALVDMRNANFVDAWNDLVVSGTGYDLRVQRIYNSRTIYSGIFGFGWCSDFETKLEVNGEGNLKVTECGGGLEVIYAPKSFDPKSVDKTVQIIMAEVKKRNPSKKPIYFSKLSQEIRTSQLLRDEFVRSLNLSGRAKEGLLYLAKNRQNDSIQYKNHIYTRRLPNGTFQIFNKKGKIIAFHDKNGNYLKIKYDKTQSLIKRVIDNNGQQLAFSYHPNSKLIKSIRGPKGLVAAYEFVGQNLISVINAWKNRYDYKYDKLHNLTKIVFPDKTFKLLTYNQDKDWVTSFTDRKGCKESYFYKNNPKKPLDHYWSIVKKVCGTKVVNNSRYEFWHKKNSRGRYLHRAKTTLNGSVTDITYHPVFGRPLSILAGGVRTSYDYYKTGRVKYKKFLNKISTFFYEKKCQKISRIKTKTFQKQKGKIRKVASGPTESTHFFYEPKKCNLVKATTNKGHVVKLKHDTRGRISEIKDQSKKVVRISYNNQVGKPSIIKRPGLGSIHITYKKDGSIKKTKSPQGLQVARQIASVFNNLLEVISPATSELAI